MVRAKLRMAITGAVVALSMTCWSSFAKETSPGTVRHIATIKLSVVRGYVDYLIMNPGGPLYAGYASNNSLVIVDIKNRKVAKKIGGLKDVRSVALVPDSKVGFTSNRGDNTIGIIDLKSGRLLRRIQNGTGPDAIIYNAADRLVYVANHEGRSATLIDPSTETIRAVVPLGGVAEYAQADPATGLVYQNLQDRNEIAVVDPKKMAVVARFKTSPGTEPTGLALDAANHRLFCACRNNRLIVINEENGKVVTSLPIGSGVDSVAYDPGLRRIYSANGESGTMTVIHQDSPDKYQVMENVPTYKDAHALAVDLSTHRIYVVHGNTIEAYEAISESSAPRREQHAIDIPAA